MHQRVLQELRNGTNNLRSSKDMALKLSEKSTESNPIGLAAGGLLHQLLIEDLLGLRRWTKQLPSNWRCGLVDWWIGSLVVWWIGGLAVLWSSGFPFTQTTSQFPKFSRFPFTKTKGSNPQITNPKPWNTLFLTTQVGRRKRSFQPKGK